MKAITLILLLIFCACGFGQYVDTTIVANFSVPVPQGVFDQINEFVVFVETTPQGQAPQLSTGMSYASALAIPNTIFGSYQSNQTSVSYLVPANGYQLSVGVFALNSNDQEIDYLLDPANRYIVHSGVGYIPELPFQQTTTIHDVYIQVNVTIQ